MEIVIGIVFAFVIIGAVLFARDQIRKVGQIASTHSLRVQKDIQWGESLENDGI